MAVNYPVDPLTASEYDPDLYSPQSLAEGIDGWEAWDESVMQQYRNMGFVVVRGGLTGEQLETARTAIEDLVMGRVPEYKGVQFEAWAGDRLEEMSVDERLNCVRKLMYFNKYEPRLDAICEDPKLKGAVARVMGAEPEMFQDMALLKPPGGREKPWHQDNAYFGVPEGTPVVGVWISLDTATPRNGGMHFVPGSHRDGPVVHFQRRDWQICDTDILGRPCVAARTEPGDLIIFDGLTHHGTPHNPTDQRRRSLQFHYAPVGTRRDADEDRLRQFGSEGKNVSC